MQKSTSTEPETDAKTRRGMDWIGKVLQSTAENLNVRIHQWTWQIDPLAPGDRLYSLVVVGTRGKRAIKLFNKQEIENCPTDRMLQQEIQLRLAGILSFVGPNH